MFGSCREGRPQTSLSLCGCRAGVVLVYAEPGRARQQIDFHWLIVRQGLWPSAKPYVATRPPSDFLLSSAPPNAAKCSANVRQIRECPPPPTFPAAVAERSNIVVNNAQCVTPINQYRTALKWQANKLTRVAKEEAQSRSCKLKLVQRIESQNMYVQIFNKKQGRTTTTGFYIHYVNKQRGRRKRESSFSLLLLSCSLGITIFSSSVIHSELNSQLFFNIFKLDWNYIRYQVPTLTSRISFVQHLLSIPRQTFNHKFNYWLAQHLRIRLDDDVMDFQRQLVFLRYIGKIPSI